MAPRHFRGDDRVAVITGAGRGIGESLARELTQHGFRVVLGDIDKAAVQATAMAVGARAVPVAGDMRDPRTAAALVQAALQGFGRLDVWINNAGVIGDGPFEEQVPAHAARMVEVNLGAVLAGCRAVWPVMRAQGGGHIVNVASVCAVKPLAGLAVYSATKAAVAALSEALRREGRPVGIHTSVVAPYMVSTPAAAGLRQRLLRPLCPTEVARAVVGVLHRPRGCVVVPRSLGPVLSLGRLLPQRLRDLLDDVMGLDTIALNADRTQRTAYWEALTSHSLAAAPIPVSGEPAAVLDSRRGRDDAAGRSRDPSRDRAGHAPCHGTDQNSAGAMAENIDRLHPARPTAEVTQELLAVPALLGSDAAERVHQRLCESLVQPVQNLLDSGGQRWPSRLMTAVLEALGSRSRSFGPLMAAFELMYAGTSIIDDCQHDSPLRPGRSSGHVPHDTAFAVNAGTAAYFTMDRALGAALPSDSFRRMQVYEVYLAALRATHAGRALDLQGHHEEMNTALSTGHYEPLFRLLSLTHQLKPGALFGALCHTAALLAEAAPAQCSALARLGEAVGTACQITDDVADLEGVRRDGAGTQQAGEDLLRAKVTFPLARTVALLPRQDATTLWQSLVGGLDTDGSHRVAARIHDCGALARCRADAETLLDDAWAGVRGLLPDSLATARLRQVCTDTVYRRSVG